jgi:hypothetical protein
MYYGITIEDTDTPDSIVGTVKRIKQETHRKVAVRIVIDPERDVTASRGGDFGSTVAVRWSRH